MTVDEESKLYADTLSWMARARCVEWPPCAPKNWTRLDATSGPLDWSLLAGIDFVMLNGVKWHELKGAHDEWKRCYRRSLFAEIAEIAALLAVLRWVWTVHSALAIALSLVGLLWMQAYQKVYGFRNRAGRAKRITKALEELLKTQRPDLAKQERW
jgi:hypothetical protein